LISCIERPYAADADAEGLELQEKIIEEGLIKFLWCRVLMKARGGARERATLWKPLAWQKIMLRSPGEAM
jgi:hypothetical protein